MSVTLYNSKVAQQVHHSRHFSQQAKLRDDINRLTTQIGGLEQLLTLALVSLPQNTPQMTAFTEQLADEIRSRGKKNSEMVHRY